MGGYGSKQINYEGYGRTKKEAVSVLDALLRYHHSNIQVYVAKDPASVPPLKPRYYVLDGQGEHPVLFDQQRKWIRAYVRFD